MPSHQPGSLVQARGRSWVVLPGEQDGLLPARPLGASAREDGWLVVDGPLAEPVASDRFAWPSEADLGDAKQARVLRDALRLGLRSSTGPFRSFASLNVEPRAYQLVPLLLALKQDPVRVLLADDVGIGKTVEALLIARELLDRGEVESMAVLCPPHLAEQWQRELMEKANLKAELVLAGTAARLERGLVGDDSLFWHHRITVVSLDFIKSEQRRDEFVRRGPQLVLVDEAHACAPAEGGRQRRFELLQDLAKREDRHLVLITATPHAGKPESFRGLLGLLNPQLARLPEDLSGEHNRSGRELLARYMVQRRRGDVRGEIDAQDGRSLFPVRKAREATYLMEPELAGLQVDLLAFCRQMVAEPGQGSKRRRVREWVALGLLRALASSPEALAASLEAKARRDLAALDQEGGATQEMAQLEAEGRALAFDAGAEDELASDALPELDMATASPLVAEVVALAKRARALTKAQDSKYLKALNEVKHWLKEGHSPIVFCRFIATAEALGKRLAADLPKDVRVVSVTGGTPPDEREAMVEAMGEAERRVLVATDCLSEGVNLQHHFNAVLHYDLAWNPNRHEQREGRVDRFGQSWPEVQVLTLYGENNPIDQRVMEVLVRKHVHIRKDLNVSVPVPGGGEAFLQSLARNLLEGPRAAGQAMFEGLEAYVKQPGDELMKLWAEAGEREKKSRSLFAQEALKPQAAKEALDEVRHALGLSSEVLPFLQQVFLAMGVPFVPRKQGVWRVQVDEAPLHLRQLLRAAWPTKKGVWDVATEHPAPEGVPVLTRTHPLVAALAAWVLGQALDRGQAQGESPAARAGVMRTLAVGKRTALLVVRFRFLLQALRQGRPHGEARLVEEVALLGLAGSPSAEALGWLPQAEAEALLQAQPEANMPPDLARSSLAPYLEAEAGLVRHLEAEAEARAKACAEAHEAVRQAAEGRGGVGLRSQVSPVGSPDVLGLYVLLPVPQARVGV